MDAKLRRDHGSFRVEYASEHGSGYIWLADIEDEGVVRIAVYGKGDIHVEEHIDG